MEVPAGANFAERGIHGESSRRNENSRIRTEIENTTEGEFWPEMQTLPQQLFVDVSDGSKGLALLNDCLTEYQLLDDDCRTLALTLFRSVRNRICTEFRSSGYFPRQKGGQCLRTLEYNYAIYLHAGDWNEGAVYNEAMAFNTSLPNFQLSPVSASRGDLPPVSSLFSIEPEALVMTAFKRAENRDSQIFRVFNPTGETVEGQIRLNIGPAKAWRVQLDEKRLDEISVNGGTIPLVVDPLKIVSIEVQRSGA